MLTHKAIRELLGKTMFWVFDPGDGLDWYLLKNPAGVIIAKIDDRDNANFIAKCPEIVEQLLKEVEDLEIKFTAVRSVFARRHDDECYHERDAECEAYIDRTIKEEAQRLIEGGK